MEKLDLEPTDENIIKTFSDNTLDRSSYVLEVVRFLNTIDTNFSIAIDGSWGCGKTFFVKQTKMILDDNNPFLGKAKKKIVLRNEGIESIPTVSVYYDAWSNDNDTDPILSLVYSILQQSDISLMSEKTNFKKIGKEALKCIIKEFTKIDVSGVIDSLKSEDFLSEIVKAKDIHEQINMFFDSLLKEKGFRLVIFIDELDRCKPTFAVKLLERIKHYFTNKNISFVFSVNLNELQHTIKQCYGSDFNAMAYFDKFFDFRLNLPKPDSSKYCNSFIEKTDSRNLYYRYFTKVAEIFDFELREITRYIQLLKYNRYKTEYMIVNIENDDVQVKLLSFINSLILALELKHPNELKKMMTGNNRQIFIDVFTNSKIGFELDYIFDIKSPELKTTIIEQCNQNLYDAFFTQERGEIKTVGKVTVNQEIRNFIQKIPTMFFHNNL